MTSDGSWPVLETVPVAGGDLLVARWGAVDADRPVVVGVHGITSSHRSWSLVGKELADDMTLYAPDLRGRGDSAGLPGPSSIATHAEDVAAVLDHSGARDAVVVGHSMGGFVAATLALLHPERVRALVLIDGGPPMTGALPPDADVDAVLHSIIGPSLERLSQRFASREAYREFWRNHPAFGDVPLSQADAYADHDLTGTPPDLHPKASLDAVREDARDTLVNDDVRTAVERVSCPTTFLWAERGVLDQPTGIYDEDTVAGLKVSLPHLRSEQVPDSNHFTITMSPAGAAIVAGHMQSAAAG